MNVKEQIESLRAEIAMKLERIAWLKENESKLEQCPDNPQFLSGDRLDFDNLPHKEVIKVIRAFGGKWKKSPADSGTVHYETVTKDGVTVRCYKGEPPPSCRIVEVEEFVPEQVIPASVRKIRKLVCKPDMAAEIAIARKEVNP